MSLLHISAQKENEQLAVGRQLLHLALGGTLQCASEWQWYAPIIWAVLSLVISL